ncbi:MAG: sulfatase-like hydrolase/transferase [Deltaproteobacteria bacterium]|nr:sulfatase-like hydrolase/transferase [Deltaproteobacteria bacterium]
MINFVFLVHKNVFITYDQFFFIMKYFFQSGLHLLQTSPIYLLQIFSLSLLLSLLLILFVVKLENNVLLKKKILYFFLIFILLFAAGFDQVKFTQKKDFLRHSAVLSIFSNPSYDFGGLINQDFKTTEFIHKPIKRPWVGDATPQTPVIVLMVESLRWDLLTEEPTPLPFLKRLAEESIRFEKAYVSSSHSNYADLSVWYSQYPLKSQTGAPYPANSPWKNTSIFKVFKDMGYRTAYISSQNEKWGGMIHWLKVPEIDFFYHSEDFDGDTWFNKDDKNGISKLINKNIATAGKIEDSQLIQVIRRWIDHHDDKPFFLGANLQNTHFNYVIPPGGAEPFQPAYIDFPTVYFSWPREKADVVRNRYRNAVYNVDNIIRGFVDYLRNKGIWDHCYFIVVGDSGEAFYEHGFGNHSGPVYDEVARTFLIIHTPKEGKIIKKILCPVSHIDIFPTLLDLMNIEKPCSFQGISVFREDQKRENVFMYVNAIYTQLAVLNWPYKYMLTIHPQKNVELYDLDQDPQEKNNIIEKNQVIADILNKKLKEFVSAQIRYYGYPLYSQKYCPPCLQ